MIFSQVRWAIKKSGIVKYTWHKTDGRAGQRNKEFSSVRSYQHGLLPSRRKSEYRFRIYAYPLDIQKILNKNGSRQILREKMYPPPADPYKVIKCVEWMDDAVVEAMTDKILGKLPNTYAFTKALSERIIEESMSQIPAIILRYRQERLV